MVLGLQLQTDWSTHAQHLKDGKPCPLCGATSHPKPLSQKGLDSRLAKARDRVGKLESELEAQRQLEQNLEIVVVQLKLKSDVLTSNRGKHTDISREIQLHLDKYPGDKIPVRRPSNLPKRMASTQQIINQIEKSLTELDAKIIQREELKGKQQKHAQLLESTALEHEKLRGKIDELKGMIKVLDREVFLKKTEPQLQAHEQQLVGKILVDERNYQLGMSNLTRVEKKLNHQKGLLQSTEAQVNEIRTQNITMESEMAGLCKKHGLKGIVEVQGILKMNLNEGQERSEIEKYRSDLLALQARQKSLRKQMGKKVYLESEHVKLEQEFHELKSSLDQLQQQLSSKQHVLQQYQSQLKKKETLEKEFKQISLRKDHVQEISNLLRGNGFINFISSIYLQNLCKSANVRFQRLTNNRLSLELGDHNEFFGQGPPQ